jgi:uncharacterized membrane protein
VSRAGDAFRLGKRLAPPRFVLFLVLLPAALFAYRALTHTAAWLDPLVVAFDFAATVFLLSLVPLLRDSEAADIRKHAAENDAGRGMVLLVTTLLTFAVMAAITGELKAAQGGDKVAMVKLIGTLFAIWLFANTVYALHYAHLFYSREPKSGKDAAGIDFPGTKTPDYRDFAYFAGTLGMTFQTSDTAITAPKIRHVALAHSFVAFVFNIGVIAFTINTLGGK